ncbi:hypothetical protein JAAARDRAFT_201897 [Jaapia argillacea MUCL 33604]|uniref:Pyrimidine 5-nucleotidase n=1 Tax=Jaapia argillacea MUCL 33604 TaxID=933084 RepID=A0A067QM31_9AGAM|nr:hypothetical protein JAAARDRAFT_201897 [Jaapia argillacea MUCL 33604]
MQVNGAAVHINGVTTQVNGAPQDERLVVWFDIDNTLYSASSKISQAMGKRILGYFLQMGFDQHEASELHLRYYAQYGLAIRGLVRHHDIDPFDFDAKCDGSLPLEEMIKPDPGLRKLFEDIDRTRVRVWALTNAYRTHAQRVLRILGIDDLIEGLVYCDYAQPNFYCKPEKEFYDQALQIAQTTPQKSLFIDDNRANVEAAKRAGWSRCVHFSEHGLEIVEGGRIREIDNERLDGGSGVDAEEDDKLVVVSTLEELRVVWSDIFKKE